MSYITVWDEKKKRWDMRVDSPSQRMHLLFHPHLWAPKPKRIRAAWLAVKAAFQVYQYAMGASA